MASERDWKQGLPADVLAMVAVAGGLKDMGSMRGVCKSWERGFMLAVSCLKIHFEDPAPAALWQRCPGITSLDLGESEAWTLLAGLNAFPRLETLFLGSYDRFMHAHSITRQLTDADLANLRGLPLTRLDLAECHRLTAWGLRNLHGMPLIQLSMYALDRVQYPGLECLRGMSLRDLDLYRCRGLSGADCLEPLQALRLLPAGARSTEGSSRCCFNTFRAC